MSKKDFEGTVIHVEFTDMTFSKRAIATAEEVAAEITRRIHTDPHSTCSNDDLARVRLAAFGTLLDWFNGDLKPGEPPTRIYVDEAAAEIERQRAENARLQTGWELATRAVDENERLRRELNLLRAVHENAEAEVKQLLDENGPLIAVCREFIDQWPTEQGIDNTIQRARAILLDHDLRSPPGHAVNRALEAK